MEALDERFNEIEEIIYSECGEAVQLQGDKLQAFKKRLFIDWEPDPIFYTKSTLIMVEVHDYERVKMVWGSMLKEVIKLELKTYNHYLYVVDISEVDELSQLLNLEEEEHGEEPTSF